MTTGTKIPDETSIEEIVSSPRSVKHLVAAGYETLGDVRTKGIAGIFELKYIGPVGIEEIKAAIGPQPEDDSAPETDPAVTAADDEPEFEEGPHPIVLSQLPRGPGFLAWSPAHKVAVPGEGHRIQKGLMVEFDQKTHEAKVTQRMYLMRRFRRDMEKVEDAVERNLPWRQACAEMIRRDFTAHGTGFVILPG